ncbi:MAG: hypothetical protein QM621_15080 [Aeromicrobium sp.]|uniref:hypothetical protein n=1 Tax=Aeromicrobium sp. TaxID=1871063 RepID=UPI0039E56822
MNTTDAPTPTGRPTVHTRAPDAPARLARDPKGRIVLHTVEEVREYERDGVVLLDQDLWPWLFEAAGDWWITTSGGGESLTSSDLQDGYGPLTVLHDPDAATSTHDPLQPVGEPATGVGVEVTEAAVDAAAVAVRREWNPLGLGGDLAREQETETARAVITAALPHLTATALDYAKD